MFLFRGDFFSASEKKRKITGFPGLTEQAKDEQEISFCMLR